MPLLPDIDLIEALREVSARNGYTLEVIDPCSGLSTIVSDGFDAAEIEPVFGFLLKVSLGPRSFVTGAGELCSWPINRATPCTIARDKARASALLRREGLPIPKGQAFLLTDRYGLTRGPSLADVPAYAVQIGYPVVVKPNKGSLGWCVDLAEDAAQVCARLEEIGRHQPLGLVEEWIRGQEYRIVVLDGRPEYAYRKTRPMLAGDGESTISGLLERRNTSLLAVGNSAISSDSYWLRESLKLRGLNLGSVLAAGETVEYAFRANISGGGRLDDVRYEIPDAVADLCKRAVAVLDLRIAGLDLILPDGMDNPARAYIIEVNPSPWISALFRSGHAEKIYEVWRKVCRIYFSST